VRRGCPHELTKAPTTDIIAVLAPHWYRRLPDLSLNLSNSVRGNYPYPLSPHNTAINSKLEKMFGFIADGLT
jgi:hypothetical protein